MPPRIEEVDIGRLVIQRQPTNAGVMSRKGVCRQASSVGRGRLGARLMWVRPKLNSHLLGVDTGEVKRRDVEIPRRMSVQPAWTL